MFYKKSHQKILIWERTGLFLVKKPPKSPKTHENLEKSKFFERTFFYVESSCIVSSLLFCKNFGEMKPFFRLRIEFLETIDFLSLAYSSREIFAKAKSRDLFGFLFLVLFYVEKMFLSGEKLHFSSRYTKIFLELMYFKSRRSEKLIFDPYIKN